MQVLDFLCSNQILGVILSVGVRICAAMERGEVFDVSFRDVASCRRGGDRRSCGVVVMVDEESTMAGVE